MIELKAEMASAASTYIDKIPPSEVDLTIIKEYVKAIPYKQKIDDFNAPDIVNKCLELKNKTNECATVCESMKLEAKRRVEKAWSNALLYDIKSDERMATMNLTSEVRKAYANLNSDVQKYEDLRNAWEVLFNYFLRLHDDMTDNYYYYKRVFEYKHAPQPTYSEGK